jgi:hypothetical protein
MAFLKPLVRDTIGPRLGLRGRWRLLSPILDSCAREQLAEARYRSGLARIFGLLPLANGTEGTHHAGAFLEERLSILAKPTPNEDPLKMPTHGKLPPLAEDALRRLMGDAGIGRAAPPPS